MKNFYKFSAIWCGSCKMIEPKWKEIKEEYKTSFNFMDVDVDSFADMDLVNRYINQISVLPAFIITNENGQVLDNFSTVEESILIDHLRNAL